MATITGFTAARMLEIEEETIVDGEIRPDGNLWLIKRNGEEINAGPAQGPPGPVGPQGPSAISAIPGEVKLWAGGVLPTLATYGRWVWADGAVYPVSSHPIAAGHIATQWRTFGGASDPGGSNFRVPDLRGLVPAGLDAMPGGSRANRMTRSVAITLAAKTGEEQHVITIGEMASHGHNINDPGHGHGVNDPGHSHGIYGGQGGSYSGFVYQDSITNDYIGDHISASGTGITLANGGTGISIQNNGANGAHENVQPTVFVPYIVYLDG